MLFSGQGKQLRGKGAGRQVTLQLFKKKKVQNAIKVVDDVRRDGVGHWPAHTETRRRFKLCTKAYVTGEM